jgi:predicted house-cleaning noncanonical NTP pyrophosphatase (MazG superfamily)
VKSWHRRETKTAGGLGLGQGKLVRDKIPQIIRSKGLQPITYVADVDEYGARLRDKLAEEVDEFIASTTIRRNSPTFLRVLYALAEHAGTSREQLERLQAAMKCLYLAIMSLDPTGRGRSKYSEVL